MVEQLSRQRILDYIKACYSGDLERAASYYDDDIDFICYAPIELFPTLGHKKGKQAMTGTLLGLHKLYGKIDYDVEFIVAEGDQVAMRLAVRLVRRDSGRVVTNAVGNFFTLRAGRILVYRQFMDSFDLVQQVTGRDLVAALKPPT